MATVALSRRVGKVVGYPPLSELGELQRREFHEALREANGFEDLPGKWQAAIVKAVKGGMPVGAVGAAFGVTPLRLIDEPMGGHPRVGAEAR